MINFFLAAKDENGIHPASKLPFKEDLFVMLEEGDWVLSVDTNVQIRGGGEILKLEKGVWLHKKLKTGTYFICPC